jgi:hypothetical protein
VIHFNNQFIATVGSGATMHRSTNGLNWSSTPNGTGARLNALAKGFELLVAAGFDQTVFSTPNGVDWTERYRGNLNQQFRGVAYGNGQFVAVGDGGAIFSSPEVAAPATVVSLEVTDAVTSESGMNSAQIRLNRTGNLSQPVTVGLTFGGTAMAGIDYAALPASVAIPAGLGQTNLSVAAVADLNSEPKEIAAVSLLNAQGATIHPLAGSVAVFITDAAEANATPRLSAIAGAPGRGAILRLNSVAGLESAIEPTTDFLSWGPEFLVKNPFGHVLFADPAASNLPARYYRVQP